MRQYYKSDKKRREDSKRKKSEEKRAKRLNKNSKNPAESGTEEASGAPRADQIQDSKIN